MADFKLFGMDPITAIIAGVVLYVAAPILRPVAKATIKAGLHFYDSASSTITEAMEEANHPTTSRTK